LPAPTRDHPIITQLQRQSSRSANPKHSAQVKAGHGDPLVTLTHHHRGRHLRRIPRRQGRALRRAAPLPRLRFNKASRRAAGFRSLRRAISAECPATRTVAQDFVLSFRGAADGRRALPAERHHPAVAGQHLIIMWRRNPAVAGAGWR